MLTTAKLDAASHCWVTSLANYNFRLHYRAGKANIDAYALSRVSWPECIPESTSTHIKVTAAAMQAVQEAALQGSASPIEAYSSDLHILDILQDSKQIGSMTLEEWHQAQGVDPVLSLVIVRLRDGMLGKAQSKATDLPKVSQYGWEWNCVIFKKGILCRQARPRELEETLLQLVLPAAYREVALRGCHDKVGHLGLEHMLDLMHVTGSSGLAWLHRQMSMLGNAAPVSCFQSQAAKSPLKNIVATHHLELVHLENLCLETWEGPGRECFW